MKNTHIEHPEDSILNGDLTALDWFTLNGKISVKIDGAPAIVWGRNPATGNQFVGTKSVFNKVKIKINESHADIDNNHDGEVADILHTCFDCLPDTDRIIQGDFIGFGDDNAFQPNTITYVFDYVIENDIVIAPHTEYFAEKDLRDAVAQPLTGTPLSDTECCHFVQPYVFIDEHRDDIEDMCKFARQMSTMCEFPTVKQVTKVKKELNSCIREGIDIDDITLESLAYCNDIDVNVLRLWKLVQSIKMDMFAYINVEASLNCLIDGEECDHEGYVMSNDCGTFKLVDRTTFSYHNFNMGVQSR